MVHFDIVDAAIARLRHEPSTLLVFVGIAARGVFHALFRRHGVCWPPAAHVRGVADDAVGLPLALMLSAALRADHRCPHSWAEPPTDRLVTERPAAPGVGARGWKDWGVPRAPMAQEAGTLS